VNYTKCEGCDYFPLKKIDMMLKASEVYFRNFFQQILDDSCTCHENAGWPNDHGLDFGDLS
jgi:hypothetical protein